MTEKRSKKIQQILWQQKASELRKKLSSDFFLLLTELNATFLDLGNTQNIGELFWKLASAQPEIIISDFSCCKQILRPECWEKSKVVLLHRWSNDCGAIEVSLFELLDRSDEVYECFGPDFLFIEPEGHFGFCYEEDENEHVMRSWGCKCGKLKI